MFVNKDQIKGRTKEAKGKVKEVTGSLVGDAKLETRGKIEKNLGKVQAKIGDIKQDLKH
ncbi:MAG: CsbD family protein [Steroidobacteraceae bacterium]